MRKGLVTACSVFILVSATGAHAQVRLMRLTQPMTGHESPDTGGHSNRVSLSGDGNIAVFTSQSDALLAGDTNRTGPFSGKDVFIRNVSTGLLTRVMGIGGQQTNGGAGEAVITHDGRYIVFSSTASNLVASDPNGAELSTFRHDLATGVTTLVDIPAPFLKISGDGRYVGYYFAGKARVLDVQTGATSDLLPDIFTATFEFNDDGNMIAFSESSIPGFYHGTTQAFVRDRQTGRYELISRRPDGQPGNGASGKTVAISGNGRYVAFESEASDLVAADNNAVADVFVYDRVNKQTTRVSVTFGGGERTQPSTTASISATGTVVGFVSASEPPCSGCRPRREFAIYDRNLSAVQIVNVALDGTPANDTVPDSESSLAPVALDQTGRYVAFGSMANNLVLGDLTPGYDIFWRDRGTSPGCTYEVAPALIDMPATGGTATVTVTTAPLCNWAGTIPDAWVSASATKGTGSATLSIVVAANGGISRFGYLGFEGRPILIRQPGRLATTPPAIELIGVSPSGATFDYVENGAISDDGRYVAFTATFGRTATSSGYGRVYLRDRVAGVTIDVSSAPGGPPRGEFTHGLVGLPYGDMSVGFVVGPPLSADGRYLYFWGESAPGYYYVYDRVAGTSAQLPLGGCPTVNATGRFFATLLAGCGLEPSPNTVVFYDRFTSQTTTLAIPGLAADHGLLGVLPSLTGRYLLAIVSEPLSCPSPLCPRAYAVLWDRVTGESRRTETAAFFDHRRSASLRYALIDPVWAEFGLPRYHSRHTTTFDQCELIDRETGVRLPLPLLKAFTGNNVDSLDCGVAVNNGQEIVFRTYWDLSPGETHQGTDLHTLTLATGTAARLGTRGPGPTYPDRPIAVSANGRYLLTTVEPAGPRSPILSAWQTNLGVIDLGVVNEVDKTIPTNLQASVAGTTVTLTWTAPTQGTPGSYVVEATAPAAPNLARFDTGTPATSFSANAPFGTYYVRVRARTSAVTGSPSNEVVANVTAGGGCAIPPPPIALTANVDGTSVALSWQPASGATSYVIEAGKGPGLANLLLVDTGTPATSFTGAAPRGIYYVRVRSRNACGTSAPSIERIVGVGGGCALLSPPTDLTATVSSTTVTLTWRAAAGDPAGYIVEVGSSSGASDVGQFDFGAATTLSTLAPPGTYYVRVRTRTACGVGAESNEVVVQVK